MSFISDFPWRQQTDETGATYYYNAVTNDRADTFESIPLPPNWYFDASEGEYWNDALGENSEFLPGQLIENTKVRGYPYKQSSTDQDGEMLYRHKRTQKYVKESEIALPDGWGRGRTYGGERYYYQEENEEYSYRLPGEKDKPLHEATKSAYRALFDDKQRVQQRLDKIEYHQFQRKC